LGYNRRALFLKKIAQEVMTSFNGELPKDIQLVQTLPGIGPHTAASICAFAFNMPVSFVETNIRTVFIHEFFKGKKNIHDSQILSCVAQAVDRRKPSAWYNALMDYGVMLKKKYANPSRRSAHYYKQKPFEGSNRQLRGTIIKYLTNQPLTLDAIHQKIGKNYAEIQKNLTKLKAEGFIKEKKEKYCIVGDII
ncbi:MAG: A/G-specific adenine glycosylase, partial [bacterium]